MRFIGCKTLLLKDIENVINRNVKNANIFCDIFSGTGSVAKYFKKKYSIISNDLLYFSYILQKASIENNSIMEFNTLNNLTGISNPIEYFNSLELCQMEKLPLEKRFFQNTYSPNGNRMYVTNENALRIDYCRNTIELWKKENFINNMEYLYLLACLIEGIPFISNISGTYGAFNKKWDKRAFKEFKLIKIDVFDNLKSNKAYNENGIELLKHLHGDILYIDPPYNTRQYLPNYHILETASKYDFPQVRGVTGLRNYDEEKSTFCSKKTVLQSFESTLKNANFEHIIISYSTEGLLDIETLIDVMIKYGNSKTLEINKIPYRRFKSNNINKNLELKEIIAYIQK